MNKRKKRGGYVDFTKKALSVILTVCMLLSLSPAIIAGASGTQTGICVTKLKQTSSTYDIGIASDNVRLAWEMGSSDTARGVMQSAYYLKIRDKNSTIYETGWVESAEQSGIKAKNLQPETVYYWTVKVKDQYESAFAQEASFETAPAVISGSWINGSYLARKEFTLDQPLANIERARSYIGSSYRLHTTINGKKVGDLVLGPTPSINTVENYYNTYDILYLLQEGTNAVGVMTGNNGTGSRCFRGIIKIYYKDGTSQTVNTDTSWSVTASSMITRINRMKGEDVNHNLMAGWDVVGYDDSSWAKALHVDTEEETMGELVPALMGTKVIEEIAPVSIRKLDSTVDTTIPYCSDGVLYMPDGYRRYGSTASFSGDYTIEVRLKTATTFGLTFGQQNVLTEKSPAMWQLKGTKLTMHHPTTWSTAAKTISATATDWVTMQVAVSGQTVTTSINGSVVDENRSVSIAENSKIGFRLGNGENCEVDYIKVTAGGETIFEDNFNFIDTDKWDFPANGLNRYVIDFGKNMSGYVRVTAKGIKNDTITVKYAEILDADGNINPATTWHEPYCTYTLTGGDDVYEPYFFYTGFRYIEVNLKDIPTKDMFTACFISDDVVKTGNFESSNTRLNDVLKIYYQAQRSNMVGLYIDCPHREQAGWTGDVAVTKENTSILLADYSNAESFMRLLNMSVLESGKPNCIVPSNSEKNATNTFDVPWGSAYFIVPYQTYLQTGDKYYIELMYDNLVKIFDYYKTIADEDGVIDYYKWGDHAGYDSTYGYLDKASVAAAYAYESGMLLSEMAQIIGRDHTELDTYLDSIDTALQTRYNKSTYWSTDTMTENAIALDFDLVPDAQRETILQSLEKNVEDNMYMRTGVLGTYSLYNVLSEQNKHKLLLDLTTTTNRLSFGFMLDNGATSTWERWYLAGSSFNSDVVTNSGVNDSQNHCMFGGGLSTWMIEGLGGIRSTAPAYRKITYRPGMDSGLTWANSSVDTIIGKTVSNWKYEDKKLNWTVTVPVNAEAKIVIPYKAVDSIEENGTEVLGKSVNGLTYEGFVNGEHIYTAGSGTYNFVVSCADIPAESVSMSAAELSMLVGETSQLKAEVLPEDAADRSVIWSSADTSVAIVDENGNVKGMGNGKTTITATAAGGKVSGQCSVTMTEKPGYGYTFNTSNISTGSGLVPVAERIFSADFNEDMTLVAANNTNEVGASFSKEHKLYLNANSSGKNMPAAKIANGVLTVTPSGEDETYGKSGGNVFLSTGAGSAETALNGTYMTEFDFKATWGDSGYAFTIGQIMCVTSEGGDTHWIDITAKDWTREVYINGVATGLVLVEDKWYHIKVEYDVENNLCSVWINGVRYANKATAKDNSANVWPSSVKRSVTRALRIQVATGITQVYDNLEIYKQPTGRYSVWANDFTQYEGEDVKKTTTASDLVDFAGFGGLFKRASSWTLSPSKNAAVFGKGDTIRIDDITSGNDNTWSGGATVSFDFSATVPNDYIEYVYRMQANANDYGGWGANVCMSGGNLYLSYTADGKNHMLVQGVEANKTYRITLHYDPTVTSTRSCDALTGRQAGLGSIDAYVDGECKAYNVANAMASGEAPVQGGSMWRVLMVNAGGGMQGTFSLSNIELYQDEREEVVAKAFTTIGNAVENGNLFNGFSLPTALDGYNITWSSSNTSVIANDGTVVRPAVNTPVTLTAYVADGQKEYTLVRSISVTVPGKPSLLINNALNHNSSSLKATATYAPKDALVIIAVYDGNSLVDVVTNTVKENDALTQAIMSSGLLKSGSSYTAKAMLWDGKGTLVPLVVTPPQLTNVTLP